MRKIRNPRYAPEFLERKLSPTASLVAGQIALVAEYSTITTECTISDPPPPPDLPPGDPFGPSGPA